MKTTELKFDFPAELVGISPQRPARVMWKETSEKTGDWLPPQELFWRDFLQRIPSGDLFIVNETKVLKRRVFAEELEILFLNRISDLEWEVLFPAKKYQLGDCIDLPEGRQTHLTQKGRPQRIRTDQPLDDKYFEAVAELPLPPYIQAARGQRHTQVADQEWYQSAWAKNPGSLAAPTASLHFSENDLQDLRARGVQVLPLTLHVGLGTFLPVTTEDLDQHDMHHEWVHIPAATWNAIEKAQTLKTGIWSLGTTVTRSLESAALGKFERGANGDLQGSTNLLIQPGHQWRVVNRLLTNFHQPESTLLALVASFGNLQTVMDSYRWAIENKFRLFSYGDLSVWVKNHE